MLFGSYTFVLFFALVMALHYAPFSWQLKKFNLLWLSYLFYAAWNPPFVLLLIFSTVVDWLLAQRIYRAEKQGYRRLYLYLSLIANLGLLGFFKYGTFLLENFQWLLQQAGVSYHPAMPDIILPVGISFYTFQTLSYTLDVYYRRMAPGRSFLDYALYVTFFPQLVAGPIVRAGDFLPQCEAPRRATSRQLAWGLSLMIVGMFQKNVLADRVFAPVADAVFGAEGQLSFIESWAGTLAFTGQIFCDFTGYSTCAIGAALCLGFALPDNFRSPYAAIGFSDFWQRWHISLSSWLRDYLYIPLGGNRLGRLRTQINLLLTMLIGGLWHGASWTFVIWGGLHGLYLIVERVLCKTVPSHGVWHSGMGKILLGGGTFIIVAVTWVFFRAASLEQALLLLASMADIRHMAGAGKVLRGSEALYVTATMGAILTAHAFLRKTSLERVAERAPVWVRGVLPGLLLFIIYLNTGDSRAFIYFQF